MLIAIETVCLTLLLLHFVILIVHERRSENGRLLAAFTLGAACFVSMPLAQRLSLDPKLLLTLALGQSACPVFLWMAALTVSRPDFHLRPWHWGVLVAKLLVTLGSIVWIANNQPAASLRALLELPTALFSAALGALSLFEAARGLEHELEVGHRRMRLIIVGAGGATIVTFVLIHFALSSQQLHTRQIVQAAMVLVSAAGISLATLRYAPGLLIPATVVPSEPAGAIDKEVATALDRSFSDERYYRTEGLTIRQLAAHLGLQEYRLRRHINGGLGHRNFNEFLNRFRVQEACELLVSQPGLPVVRIALDLGYRSLGSFNRAFREHTGTTPTGFRAQARGNSATPPEKAG